MTQKRVRSCASTQNQRKRMVWQPSGCGKRWRKTPRPSRGQGLHLARAQLRSRTQDYGAVRGYTHENTEVAFALEDPAERSASSFPQSSTRPTVGGRGLHRAEASALHPAMHPGLSRPLSSRNLALHTMLGRATALLTAFAMARVLMIGCCCQAFSCERQTTTAGAAAVPLPTASHGRPYADSAA